MAERDFLVLWVYEYQDWSIMFRFLVLLSTSLLILAISAFLPQILYSEQSPQRPLFQVFSLSIAVESFTVVNREAGFS